jgi:uncharacterized protein YbcI
VSGADDENSKKNSLSAANEHRPLSLQISDLVSRAHKQLVGRGPASVRTHIDDDLIFCLVDGGFTRLEQTLWEHAGGSPVIEMRLQVQEALGQEIALAIEALVGRRVRSVMSSNDPAADLQFQLILLGEELAPDVDEPDTGLAARGRTAREASRELRAEQRALIAEQRQARESLHRRRAS